MDDLQFWLYHKIVKKEKRNPCLPATSNILDVILAIKTIYRRGCEVINPV
jgi:hypothetical protein